MIRYLLSGYRLITAWESVNSLPGGNTNLTPSKFSSFTDKSFDEANATVIGWGYTKEDGNGSSPDLLHQIQIPMMRNIECIKESKYSQGELKHISILPTMLCAGNYNGTQRDACNVRWLTCT